MIKITNINEILIEWAYRTRDGLPNPKSMSHQIILEGILREFGWDIEQRGELLRNLQEAKPKKDKQPELDQAGKDEVKKLGLKWLGQGYGTDATGITHKNEDGKLVKVGEKPKDGETADDTSIAGDSDQFDRTSDVNTQAATTDDGEGDETDDGPDSRGVERDGSYDEAEDTTEWEEHYREAEENGDEEALAQIKWFGEKQGWGEDGELEEETEEEKKKRKDKKAREKSEEVRAKIYGKKSKTLIDSNSTSGSAPPGDGEIKQLCLKWGYKKFEKNAIGADGKPKGKPAMGNAGSMFNEVISGEGTSILEQEPDLTEEELARVLYDQFCGTTLGNEVKGSNLDTGIGVGDMPSDVTGSERGCYSKCLVTARSSKRKHQRVQESVKSVRAKKGNEFDEPTKIHSFYGHKDSLNSQVAMIKNALNSDPPKKVYAPDGTEITSFMSEEDLYALILKGGKGGNPSDTATFVEDANGNLILNFTSDKMTTSDQQANSTLINEINNRKEAVATIKHANGKGLTPKEQKAANTEIDRHKEAVDVEQQQLKKIVAPVGDQMLIDADANHPQATDDFIEEWESDDDGLATAAHWKDWQESIAKDQVPEWTLPLTQEQKRCAAKLLMKVTAGEANRPIDPNTDKPTQSDKPEVKVDGCKTKRWLSNDMAKIPARSAARQHKAGKPGYNIKEHIETIRRNIIKMERKHLAKLNEVEVTVKNPAYPPTKPKEIKKGLGELIEAQQIVDQLHLQMMDEDDQGHPMMSHGLFEVNMGGHPVNKKVLQECLAEGDEDFDSDEFIAGFQVMSPTETGGAPSDRYSWSCTLPKKEPKPKDPKNPTKKEISAHKKWKDKWGKATNPRISKKTGEISKKYGSGTCADGTPRRATGRVMFIYAVLRNKDGGTRLVKVAEKNMRTKTGDLGKYDTTVTYHDDMKKCIEEESAKQ